MRNDCTITFCDRSINWLAVEIECPTFSDDLRRVYDTSSNLRKGDPFLSDNLYIGHDRIIYGTYQHAITVDLGVVVVAWQESHELRLVAAADYAETARITISTTFYVSLSHPVIRNQWNLETNVPQPWPCARVLSLKKKKNHFPLWFVCSIRSIERNFDFYIILRNCFLIFLANANTQNS